MNEPFFFVYASAMEFTTNVKEEEEEEESSFD